MVRRSRRRIRSNRNGRSSRTTAARRSALPADGHFCVGGLSLWAPLYPDASRRIMGAAHRAGHCLDDRDHGRGNGAAAETSTRAARPRPAVAGVACRPAVERNAACGPTCCPERRASPQGRAVPGGRRAAATSTTEAASRAAGCRNDARAAASRADSGSDRNGTAASVAGRPFGEQGPERPARVLESGPRRADCAEHLRLLGPQGRLHGEGGPRLLRRQRARHARANHQLPDVRDDVVSRACHGAVRRRWNVQHDAARCHLHRRLDRAVGGPHPGVPASRRCAGYVYRRRPARPRLSGPTTGIPSRPLARVQIVDITSGWRR